MINAWITILDLSIFESRYRNDKTGAPAYAPAILLKIILYAYACGVISSRRIAKACEENLIFMALAAGAQPHFTTIAHFVSSIATVGSVSCAGSVCNAKSRRARERYTFSGALAATPPRRSPRR